MSPAHTALLVSPCADDRTVLDRMFRQQNWKLSAVETLGAALTFLSHTTVPLVISERDLPLASWKDLLRKTRDLGQAPLLVVVSRLADEYLWAEVLNLGGHDVLAKPLCESETQRVVRHAFDRWASMYHPPLGRKALSALVRTAAGGLAS